MQATTVAKPMYTQLNDRTLVTQIKTTTSKSAEREMRLALYQRYDRFVHKHWHSLSERLNQSAAVKEVKDDFYNESYIAFEKALNAVKVSKIENDQWRFLGYYGFYLSTLQNNYAKGVINKYNAETSLEVPSSSNAARSVILSDLAEQGTVPSAEEEILIKDSKTRFWKALSTCKDRLWCNQKNTIWDMRANGDSIKEVCQVLQVSTWKFNKILDEMKLELSSQVEVAR